MSSKRAELAASRGLVASVLVQQQYRREVRPVVASTQRNYRGTRKLLLESVRYSEADRHEEHHRRDSLHPNCWFLSFIGYTAREADATLEDGSPLLPTVIIKRFLDWYVAGSKGTIGDYVTKVTCENTWHKLAAYMARCTGNEYPRVAENDIMGIINGTLRSKYPVEHVIKDPRYADEVDLDVLLDQLWVFDPDDGLHPRRRV